MKVASTHCDQDDSFEKLVNKINLEVINFPIITSIVSVQVISRKQKSSLQLTAVITLDGEKDLSV